jgi:hypothetical protein
MRLHRRIQLLIAVLVVIIPLITLPATSVEARPAVKQITITITEAQLNKYLPSVRPSTIKKIAADIIEGGIIVKMYTRWTDLPEYHEAYGVLIRDGKVVTEAGVVNIPGVGALGYEVIKQKIPSMIPTLDHNAKIFSRYVLRQVSAKAGSRYTPVSVTTGNDKIVIVVSK